MEENLGLRHVVGVQMWREINHRLYHSHISILSSKLEDLMDENESERMRIHYVSK